MGMYFLADKGPEQVKSCPGFGNDRIAVNSQYITKHGKPWLPVMGECHYSRIPCEKWEETLQKMKDGGIEIVASYVFWIHHEEEKGKFDFGGNRNIRRFIELCHELGLEFCLRIGPWAHGECRNGGFPDWLCRECSASLRSDSEPYLGYVRRYIQAVADQIMGCDLFGIQVENEMVGQPDYMEHIRRIIVDAGLKAPLFTATGWGNAKLPDTLLPMYGGYPEAPWMDHVHELEPNANFFFSYTREDGNIGLDLLGISDKSHKNIDKKQPYPFMTCELGGGNQATYHRRPLITHKDIEALVICKLGSGINLLGYYMYAGGLNPVGKTTMQESKSTGYPNDCPVISYDFKAPIGDMGQLRESWFRLASIHGFLHSFGDILAPMRAVMPSDMPSSLEDVETLRCALRTDGDGGFLFINNHIRLRELPARKSYPFRFDFKNESVAFALDIPSDISFFIPVNLRLAGLHIRYASAQPVAHSAKSLTLQQIPGIEPIVSLKDGQTIHLTAGDNCIGETNVVLVPYVPYVPSALTRIDAVEVADHHSSALLMEHLRLKDRTAEYAVRWSDEDKWMVIRAQGNIAGFYADNALISDTYLDGDAWVIDLRYLKAKEGYIKIQPFFEEDRDTVYIECPFAAGVHVPEVYVSQDAVISI